MNFPEKVFTAPDAAGPEIDLQFLGRFLRFLWRNKALFAVCGLAAIVAAAIWMRIAAPIYQAETTLMPNPNETPSNSSRASSLGNLLDLGLGGGDSPNFVKFVETLRSYRLAERLQDRHLYLQRIFPDAWNEGQKKWVPRRTVMSVSRWIFLGRDSAAPNVTTLQDFIRNHMTVDEDKKNHSLLMRFRSTDPVLAVSLLRDIQEEADGLLREDSRSYTQHAVDYLDATLRGITAEDHRRALTTLLIDYERTLILVSDNHQAFASIVVDPPTLASLPVSPKGSLVYAGFLFMAALLASALSAWRTRSQPVD